MKNKLKKLWNLWKIYSQASKKEITLSKLNEVKFNKDDPKVFYLTNIKSRTS